MSADRTDAGGAAFSPLSLDELRAKAASLPRQPGVYIWFDDHGRTIYVGKARDLRARVTSYFRAEGDGRPQIPFLMSQAAGLDYLLTGSEIEALVTEANLIRARKPRYNVRLKDDKRYPYVKITKETYPQVFVTRTIKEDGARYLGPYTDVAALRRMVDLMHNIFPLRKCRLPMPGSGRTRACLNYQIGKCSGPCMSHVSPEEYRSYVEDAYRFLTGRHTDLIRDLARRMREASDALMFEKAAQLRDLADAVRKVDDRHRAFSQHLLTGDWDTINYALVDTEACVVVMEIRDGNVFGKKDYQLGGIQYAARDRMLATFLLQYYLRASAIPPEIHLPEPPEDASMLERLLGERRGAKCALKYPERGEKARLSGMARLNAETILKETLEKRERKRDQVPRTALALKRDLHLDAPPRTIACIDISHLGGADTVGSLVFFRDGAPEKKEYRRFRIETVEGIDDFASMREVVERYFRRRIEESRELPDLLLVDGGKGQLSSAVAALKAVGRPGQSVAGLAKRLEEVFLPGAPDPQNIPKTSSSIHLLQRVRDEAHRFAVTYQRKLRTKRTISSTLTSLRGVGDKTAAELLKRFGSVDSLHRATIEEIATVPGIGLAKARDIHEQLRNRSAD